MKKKITAEQRVLWAALAWQEYNDRVGSRWVKGSPIGKLLTTIRRLRKLRRSQSISGGSDGR